MTAILLVGAGGFIGSAVRYIINKEVQQLLIAPTGFPYGIVLVNVVGCLIIGVLSGLLVHGIWGQLSASASSAATTALPPAGAAATNSLPKAGLLSRTAVFSPRHGAKRAVYP